MKKGGSLETLILASQRGVRITQVPNGVRYLPGGRPVPCRGPVDFTGTVEGTGRALFLDAKECQLKTRFPVGNKTHVAPHQVAELVKHGRAGAVAGLLIEAKALRRLYWLPWEALQNHPASYEWTDPAMVEIGDSLHAVRWDRVPGVASKRLADE